MPHVRSLPTHAASSTPVSVFFSTSSCNGVRVRSRTTSRRSLTLIAFVHRAYGPSRGIPLLLLLALSALVSQTERHLHRDQNGHVDAISLARRKAPFLQCLDGGFVQPVLLVERARHPHFAHGSVGEDNRLHFDETLDLRCHRCCGVFGLLLFE